MRRVAEEVFAEKETKVEYLVGTMIELPRAALVADEIAKEAEFFSFGTNDLTQTTFGFSRDDINKFLPTYLEEGILKQDPFAVIDQEGVGELVRMGIERGRKTRPDLEGRHLRRTRRRALVGRVLPPRRAGLRLLLALPRADRAPGRRPGRRQRGAESGNRKNQVTPTTEARRHGEIKISVPPCLRGFIELSADGRSASGRGSRPIPTTAAWRSCRNSSPPRW